MRLPHRQQRILVATSRDHGVERLPHRKLGARHPHTVLGHDDKARSFAILDDVGNSQGRCAGRTWLASQERYGLRAGSYADNVTGFVDSPFVAAESPNLSLRKFNKAPQALPSGFPVNLV